MRLNQAVLRIPGDASRKEDFKWVGLPLFALKLGERYDGDDSKLPLVVEAIV